MTGEIRTISLAEILSYGGILMEDGSQLLKVDENAIREHGHLYEVAPDVSLTLVLSSYNFSNPEGPIDKLFSHATLYPSKPLDRFLPYGDYNMGRGNRPDTIRISLDNRRYDLFINPDRSQSQVSLEFRREE